MDDIEGAEDFEDEEDVDLEDEEEEEDDSEDMTQFATGGIDSIVRKQARSQPLPEPMLCKLAELPRTRRSHSRPPQPWRLA